MINLQALSDPIASPPGQAVGRVINILPDGCYIVCHQQRGWQCRLAASCLLQPQPGDEVLVAGNDAQLWLLAVLDRADNLQPWSLRVAGDLHIAAQGALTLHGAERLELRAPALAIRADRGDCRVGRMRYHGQSLSARVDICCIVGKRLESVWQTLVQISHRWLRKVTQTEHARVGQLDYQAVDYARIHGQNVMITAEAVARLDSEQIHLG
ncbi:DUF3540 domain-containing protein [Acerihabitans arboris]|uniref:DUF3540 domain-containing protein n=1 Tax=Acerihabitans arboris TaxID=2691583 RepID=A0A845SMF1_9GAMM|nr:DUF3540 domain-containing protein [Acerihabitans arboris]NDL64397.1 DUF3540 domain-containing protein [Acerihabitans arboris]